VSDARVHARAQEGRRVVSQPTIPPTSATNLPPEIAAADVVWDETLGAGAYASRWVGRGCRVRFTDLEGDTNLNLVLHHAPRPIERLNVADTLKLQWNAYPGPGSLLLSDMGRVLASVMDDVPRGAGQIGAPVDLLCGASTPVAAEERYGAAGSESATPCGRDRLLLGLAKHGLARRHLPPAANLFTIVRVADGGGLQRHTASDRPGTHVTLRAELDLIVTVAVTPHPLDQRDRYIAGPVRVTAWSGSAAGDDDPARAMSPEARRAFENTDDYLLSETPGAARRAWVDR
jgi:hypothetical protein